MQTLSCGGYFSHTGTQVMKHLIIISTVLGFVTSNLSAGDKANINNGLSVAATLSNFMEKGDFHQTLTHLASSIGPYLSAVGPIVGFILGLIGSQESAELTYMKQMMKHIDDRFDRLDGKFDDLNRKIDYVHIQIDFGTIAQNIHALSAEFEKLYNSNHATVAQQRAVFIKYYESSNQLSGQKLYDGIMSHQTGLIKNLGEAAMDYSQNNRASTQHFLLGILKLLLQAAKLELAYLKAKGYEALYSSTKVQWQNKINAVKARMVAIDSTVASRYKTQSEADVERFSKDNAGLHNNDFSNNLYHFLASKYYWRDWMVLSYNEISGFDNHCVMACDGLTKFRYHGRNLVIASVDKTKPPISITSANSILSQLKEETSSPHCFPRGCFTTHSVHTAEEVFNEFSADIRTHCSPYAALGVVRKGSDQQFQGPPNRLVHIEQQYFSMHMFG